MKMNKKQRSSGGFCRFHTNQADLDAAERDEPAGEGDLRQPGAALERSSVTEPSFNDSISASVAGNSTASTAYASTFAVHDVRLRVQEIESTPVLTPGCVENLVGLLF